MQMKRSIQAREESPIAYFAAGSVGGITGGVRLGAKIAGVTVKEGIGNFFRGEISQATRAQISRRANRALYSVDIYKTLEKEAENKIVTDALLIGLGSVTGMVWSNIVDIVKPSLSTATPRHEQGQGGATPANR